MSVMWAEEAKYWPNNCGVMCTRSYFYVCDWLVISFSATFTIFVLEIKQFSEAVAINQNIICLLVLFVSGCSDNINMGELQPIDALMCCLSLFVK